MHARCCRLDGAGLIICCHSEGAGGDNPRLGREPSEADRVRGGGIFARMTEERVTLACMPLMRPHFAHIHKKAKAIFTIIVGFAVLFVI